MRLLAGGLLARAACFDFWTMQASGYGHEAAFGLQNMSAEI
jgi:hypothetical protein